MTKRDLSPRQARFVSSLLGGATVEEAAQAAGVTRRTGFRYLLQPAVKAELSKRQDAALTLAAMELASMSGEALAKLRGALAVLEDHAGATVADFITVDDAGGWRLDLAAAEAAGKLHLVKKLWRDAQGHDRLELHDPQAAARWWGALTLDILTERRKAAELDDLAQRVAELEKLMGKSDHEPTT